MTETLPAINATFNGISFILLCTGFVLIRQGKWRAHGMTMAAALVSSSLFLIGYVTHKVILRQEDIRLGERFPNLSETWRFIYFFIILIPHLILAIVMLPFIAKGVWHAYKREWKQHKAINRVTIWIWLYVSLTGVLIYYLLYHLFPRLNGQ
jgi:uncharacterized membrane protein YozB (DUF420 family)